MNSGNKYYADVLTSTGGTKFRPVKYQIDTAATCNTISVNTVQLHFPATHISKSPYLLFPYGDSKSLKPVGQVDLLCERGKKYFTLTFRILSDHVMHNKPALLSGKDNQKMGLVNIHADEIHALEPKPLNHSPKYQLKPTQPTSNNSDHRCHPPQPLLKKDILNRFSSTFSGIGCLQSPVSFHTKPDIPPIQMPIHRVPICKRVRRN